MYCVIDLVPCRAVSEAFISRIITVTIHFYLSFVFISFLQQKHTLHTLFDVHFMSITHILSAYNIYVIALILL